MRLHRLFGFFLALEDYIAGGIVDPFYPEMRVHVEVISDELVAHVIYSEQVPGAWPQLHVLLCEIGHLALIEEFCIKALVLSSFCTFSSG